MLLRNYDTLEEKLSALRETASTTHMVLQGNNSSHIIPNCPEIGQNLTENGSVTYSELLNIAEGGGAPM
jgi:hypothetical protein